MSISVVDRKLLWGRAGNRCAWAGCVQRLTIDLKSPESGLLSSHGAVLGEEAHIRSERSNGPRHDARFPADDLDQYRNLVLLCPTHHTIIDKDNGAAWSTEEVQRIKDTHERLVDGSMNSGELKSRDLEERFAALISVWESKLDLDHWQDLSWNLNNVFPALPESEWTLLFDTSEWLLERRWPAQYPKTAAAFENHRRVLTMLVQHLSEGFEFHNGWYSIDRPHTRIDWNPELCTQLLSSTNVNSKAIWLLIIELTRSVNLIISVIAEEFDPLYRLAEGFVLMADGDLVSGRSLIRLEYELVDWDAIPHEYELTELLQRMTQALAGGDPRRVNSIDLHAIVLDAWLAEAGPGLPES